MLQAVCEAEMALQDTEGPWQQGGNSGLAAAFRRLTVAAAGSVDFRKPTSGAAKTSGFGGLADDVISVIGQRLCGGRSGIARRASEAAAAISALHRRAHASMHDCVYPDQVAKQPKKVAKLVGAPAKECTGSCC